MTNFSTQTPIKDMTRQELLMEYLAIYARNHILEKENGKLLQENKNIDDTLRSVVRLYLGRGKND